MSSGSSSSQCPGHFYMQWPKKWKITANSSKKTATMWIPRLMRSLWEDMGAPHICEEAAWIVNIGAAWQGTSSVDHIGNKTRATGDDPAWKIMEYLRDDVDFPCATLPRIVAWEANALKLQGLEAVRLHKFRNSTKVMLRGGLATPANIASAPELAPPLASRPRPHLLKCDIDSIDAEV